VSAHVRPATAADTSAAIAVLARAFHDHPVYRYVLPDEAVRRRRLPGLMHTMVVTMHDDAGPLDVAREAGPSGAEPGAAGAPIVGAAAWHRPGHADPGAGRMLRGVLGMALATRTRLGDWSRLGTAMERMRPEEPHWYLFHVGADPGHQARGVGSALVRRGLERVDAEGVAAHLECAPDLVGYYARFGFAEVDALALDGLDLVTMTRPARS
jgi:ribosomal protein S18 acetylase RimI-like enzyme